MRASFDSEPSACPAQCSTWTRRWRDFDKRTCQNPAGQITDGWVLARTLSPNSQNQTAQTCSSIAEQGYTACGRELCLSSWLDLAELVRAVRWS